MGQQEINILGYSRGRKRPLELIIKDIEIETSAIKAKAPDEVDRIVLYIEELKQALHSGPIYR